jgi:hypothetical protein
MEESAGSSVALPGQFCIDRCSESLYLARQPIGERDPLAAAVVLAGGLGALPVHQTVVCCTSAPRGSHTAPCHRGQAVKSRPMACS